MRLLSGMVLTALAGLVCAAATSPSWQTGRAESGAPFAVTFADDAVTPLLSFICEPDALVATVHGQTHLRDPESGQEIGDAPGSEMTGSAAQLALITDTVNAQWAWAEAEPNPAGGWDLTIRLPLDHPGLLAFPRAKMIALVNPGGGTAAAVEKADRPRLAVFVRQCRGG